MPISATDLNKAYLAYFGRPADLTGKTYFATLEQADVIKAFDASAESKALYGNDAAAKVNAIYQNLFNRDAEPAGLVYWTTLINQGRVTAAGAAFAILNGAQGTDATAVQNKLAASEAFVAAMDTTAELVGYSGLDAAASARNWLKGVTSDPASLTAAVAGAQAAVDAAVALGTGEGGAGYQLTNGTDVAAANVFTAGLVYTPGGDNRINSLQDEDRLTGTGPNTTLNATLGNANDNGGTTITPTLVNMNTINAAFTGSGALTRVGTLDLQDATGVDAVNITRISQGFGATVQNIASAASQLSVKNSQAAAGNNVAFTFLASALAGTADSTTLTVSNVTIAPGSALVVEQTGLNNNGNPLTAQGFETINLVSAGSANNIAQFQAEDLRTLNISGAQNLTIGQFNNAAGSLTLIDGSTATGNLDLNLNGVLSATADGTSGTNVALTVRTGTGADTIRITNDAIGATDSIDAGTGVDTVVLRAGESQNFTPVATGAALVSNVENLTVARISNANPNATPPVAAVASAGTLVVDLARFAGDQVTTLSNLGESIADRTTFVLANASAGDAAGIRITHGSTGNNALADNAIVLDVDAGVTTAGVEILEGTNTNPRFNFSLRADSNLTFNAAGGPVSGVADVTNSVVNITLTDSDSESNTVQLLDFAAHTGTLTISGGAAGTFLNLDATANGYGYDASGAVAADATTAVAAAFAANPAIGGGTQPSARDTAVASVLNAAAVAGELLVASSIAASAQTSDLVARLGLSNTNAQLGSGNDTIIFADRAGITAATSGLTIQDTVAGGAGTDTIVLDGNNVAMTLGASEWTNLTGVDVIRLAGAAGGTFNLRVTDQLVDQTDAGNRITIVNNDGDLRNVAENAAIINLRALSATNNVTFIGANGDGANGQNLRNAQTVILNDVTANGANNLNGGDRDVVTDYTSVGAGRLFGTAAQADAAWAANVLANREGNDNGLQIFNTAEVTIGDLANTSNFSRISFINDLATAQTLNLTLDNTTVDRLVDASHTATATQRETLTITATDNVAGGIVIGAAQMNVQAGTVGAQFNLNITAGAGADVIVGGAGADVITGGAGADVMTGGLGADTYVFGTGAAFATNAAALAHTTGGAIVAGGVDVINGFTIAQNDILTFARAGSQFDFDTAVAGVQASAALGVINTGVANGLSVFAGNDAAVVALGYTAADTVILIDADAASQGTIAGSEGAIVLVGVAAAALLASGAASITI